MITTFYRDYNNYSNYNNYNSYSPYGFVFSIVARPRR